MRYFSNVKDLGDLRQALQEAKEIKGDRFKYVELGKNKTLLMVFFNSSLRTRLSTQKAAMNLWMHRNRLILTPFVCRTACCSVLHLQHRVSA